MVVEREGEEKVVVEREGEEKVVVEREEVVEREGE